MTYRTRFAPSPNGPLHLGHAFSAVTVASRAAAMGGVWLLRHEDIDEARCPAEYISAVEEDLAWLGLEWHGSAIHQSRRVAHHRAALARLGEMGLLYPCFASRGEIRAATEGKPGWPRDPDGSLIYPGLHKSMSRDEAERRKAAGEAYALRLDMARALAMVEGKGLSFTENGQGPHGEARAVAARPDIWGDVVLGRKDIGTSYHIAVVVDDAADGITEVVRGQDLFAATGLHRLLQHLLSLPEPDYFHHPLIMGPDGRKLSKSEGAAALADWRARGRTPDEVYRQLGLDPPRGR